MDWMRFLEQTPLPLALVLGGAWMLHKASLWIASRILEPLIERHLGFLDGLEEFLKRMTQSQETLLHEFRRIVALMEGNLVAKEEESAHE